MKNGQNVLIVVENIIIQQNHFLLKYVKIYL